MFYIKFIDSVLIIAICAYIGINKSKSFSLRVEKLRILKSSFNMFKTKLNFTYEPVRDAFSDISETIYNNENNMFKSYINNLEKDNYEDAWALAVAENSYGLTNEDILLIDGFGNLLGKTDIEGQINEVELAISFLDKQILEAEEARKKNDKLYKSLGLIVGVALVIIAF